MSANQPVRSLFIKPGVNFVEILTKGRCGGRKALRDYLQMRNSQFVRQLRQTTPIDPDHQRLRNALEAVSEGCGILEILDQPGALDANDQLKGLGP